MEMDIDLKQIQRKVYISYFQDGLWDMLLGIFLLGWGMMAMYDFVAVMGGVWVVFYLVVLGLKRWLTYPRAGYIKIAEARKQQIRMVILGVVLLLLGLAVFFIFAAESRPAWFSEYFMFLLGVMFTVVIAALGYWWKVTHWYVYAAMVFLAFCVHQWLDAPLNLTFIVPGGIISLCGVAMLVRFLRKYPKKPGEGMDAGS
jgi:hypothetical protein